MTENFGHFAHFDLNWYSMSDLPMIGNKDDDRLRIVMHRRQYINDAK